MRSLSLSKCRTYPLVGCLRQAQAPYAQSLKHFIETSQCLSISASQLGDFILGVRFAPGFPLYLFPLHFSSLKISPNSQIPVPKFPNPRSRIPFPATLQKDAAAIPNALGLRATSCELWAKLLITHSRPLTIDC